MLTFEEFITKSFSLPPEIESAALRKTAMFSELKKAQAEFDELRKNMNDEENIVKINELKVKMDALHKERYNELAYSYYKVYPDKVEIKERTNNIIEAVFAFD